MATTKDNFYSKLPVKLTDFLTTTQEHITSINPHSHNSTELFYLHQGRIQMTIDNISHYLESNQLICITEGSIHSIKSVSNTPFFYSTVHFDMNLLQPSDSGYYNYAFYNIIATGKINTQIIFRGTTNIGISIINLYTKLCSLLRETPYGYELAVKGYLELILFDIISSSRETVNDISENFNIILDYIESNYANNITIDMLAQLCNMSKYYFIRYFSKQTNRTPIEYINQIRIQKACQLLKSNFDMKIVDIALSTGFQDLSYFNRCFKKEIGVTPTKYRQDNSSSIPYQPLYYKEEKSPIPFYTFSWF